MKRTRDAPMHALQSGNICGVKSSLTSDAWSTDPGEPYETANICGDKSSLTSGAWSTDPGEPYETATRIHKRLTAASETTMEEKIIELTEANEDTAAATTVSKREVSTALGKRVKEASIQRYLNQSRASGSSQT